MKLSNKVLIGFFGLVLLYMLAAFAEIRLKGDYNVLNKTTAQTESIDIKPVTHLMLPDMDQRIIIKSSNEPRIELLSISGNKLPNLKYQITGDTLELQSIEFEGDENVNIYLYLPENSIEKIISTGASLVLDEVKQTSLNIKQVAGWTTIKRTSEISNIQLEVVEEARFTISRMDLDTMTVTADNSRVDIISSLKKLEGTATNGAFVQAGNVNDITFKREDGSRLSFIGGY
ncbi:MAG: hypothetical protein AAFX87_24280 [Bacteroidota bacterium]